MDPEINKILSGIDAELHRLATEASDIIDIINYIKEASQAHENGVHLLVSYINDLTKALSINKGPINVVSINTSPKGEGSSGGPIRENKPISDPIPGPSQTITIEIDPQKSSPTKTRKFI